MKIRCVLILMTVLVASCTKPPGDGGLASIHGKVEKDVRVVLTNPATYQYTLPASDQDVFIQYGDHISPDDRVWTNYLGEFEFKTLRKGDYTIYVYSRDTTGISGVDPNHMVILKEIQIDEKKAGVDAGVFTIYDNP